MLNEICHFLRIFSLTNVSSDQSCVGHTQHIVAGIAGLEASLYMDGAIRFSDKENETYKRNFNSSSEMY